MPRIGNKLNNCCKKFAICKYFCKQTKINHCFSLEASMVLFEILAKRWLFVNLLSVSYSSVLAGTSAHAQHLSNILFAKLFNF